MKSEILNESAKNDKTDNENDDVVILLKEFPECQDFVEITNCPTMKEVPSTRYM